MVIRKNVQFDYAQVLEQLAGPEHTALPAYNALYEHVSPRLYAYAKKILKRKDLVEDLVQEIFVSIWTNRTHFKQVDDFPLWLFGAIKKGAVKVLQNALSAEGDGLAHQQKPSDQEAPLKDVGPDTWRK